MQNNALSNDCHIRRATLADSPAINVLTAELGYPATLAQTEQRLQWLLASPLHQVLLATTPAGLVIGWMVLEQRTLLEAGCVIEISAFVVAATQRGRGIGQQLLAAALQWARVQPAEKLVVCSNILRDQSHRFYLQAGFQRVKTSHCYQLSLTSA